MMCLRCDATSTEIWWNVVNIDNGEPPLVFCDRNECDKEATDMESVMNSMGYPVFLTARTV